MSSLVHRLFTTSRRIMTGQSRPRPAFTRSFYSPFTALGNSSLASPPPPNLTYEKQLEHSPEPLGPHPGTRTYVVSQPDASDKHYEVPSGAYPTSSPYINFAATEAPSMHGAQVSSTSATMLAHEHTIRTVPRHFGGVGESAAVRYREAPGEMGERGGSSGGLDLMDAKGTVSPEIPPTDRNPPPDCEIAELYSRRGVSDAWKERK